LDPIDVIRLENDVLDVPKVMFVFLRQFVNQIHSIRNSNKDQFALRKIGQFKEFEG
jgi:hypothetical protein